MRSMSEIVPRIKLWRTQNRGPVSLVHSVNKKRGRGDGSDQERSYRRVREPSASENYVGMSVMHETRWTYIFTFRLAIRRFFPSH